MGIRKNSWKDFVRQTLAAFSPQKNNLVMGAALRLFLTKVVERDLSLQDALKLSSDKDFVASIIDAAQTMAQNDLASEASQRLAKIETSLAEVALATALLKQQNEGLVEGHAVLKENTHPGKNFRSSLLTNALVGAVFYGLGFITPSSTPTAPDHRKDPPAGKVEQCVSANPPLDQLPYKLPDNSFAQNGLMLLESSNKFSFSVGGKSVCDNLNPPIPCIGAAVLPPVSHDVSEPISHQPLRHVRQVRQHNSCNR